MGRVERFWHCQQKCPDPSCLLLPRTFGSSSRQGQPLAPGPKPVGNSPPSAPKHSAAGRRREGLAPGQEILAFSSSRAAVGSHNARFPRAAAKPRRDPGAAGPGAAGERDGGGLREGDKETGSSLVPAARGEAGSGPGAGRLL